jgi:hypothetical protein
LAAVLQLGHGRSVLGRHGRLMGLGAAQAHGVP